MDGSGRSPQSLLDFQGFLKANPMDRTYGILTTRALRDVSEECKEDLEARAPKQSRCISSSHQKWSRMNEDEGGSIGLWKKIFRRTPARGSEFENEEVSRGLRPTGWRGGIND